MIGDVSARAEMCINVHVVNDGAYVKKIVIMSAHIAVQVTADRMRLINN